MDYLLNLVNQLPLFMAVFFRVGSMLLFAPIFGNANVPLMFRIAIALMFSFVLYPCIEQSQNVLPTTIIPYAFIVLREIAIGAVIGFAASMIFAAFSTAGYLVSNQIGLDMAMVVDPGSETGEEEHSISVFLHIIATFIFLMINGHHWFIKATVQSFEIIKIGGFHCTMVTFSKILSAFKSLFIIGIKICAPSLVVLFLTVFALAFMTKVAQEINVFVLAYPIKILIGIILLSLSLPFVINAMKSYMISFEKDMILLLSTM